MFQVDAFANELFKGNPAAVCPLEDWISEELMQSIAAENNLSETAFFVENNQEFDLRWFTPQAEVALCGHATLASAHVLVKHLNYPEKKITFHTKSGPLYVHVNSEGYSLDLPSDNIQKMPCPILLKKALSIEPVQSFKGKTDYLIILKSQSEVEKIVPNFSLLKTADVRGVIVSAKGDNEDFVSRFFAPAVGVDEDPVTGSAHTTLVPFWAAELDKERLTALQLSKRQGRLIGVFRQDRVELIGQAITYLIGEIELKN